VRPVVVVGGGIVGASTAYHLAAAGAAVTVVYRDAGVTARSFAWIGGSEGEWPGGADDLRPSLLDDWERLAATVPGVTVDWSGSDRCAADGAVDAAAAARALLAAARDHGARLLPDTTVTRLPRDVTVVLAAGTGVTALTGGRVPVPASPAMLMRLHGPAGLLTTIRSTPDADVREETPGVLLAAVALDPALTPPALAERTAGRLSATLGAQLTVAGWWIGDRPMPPAGPVIGFLDPDVYVTAMHSGVCLAPTAGRLAAAEILTGRPAPELARCRP
jgi:glycine/D-amino acid oxidase-like deaminating enzyme